METLEEQLIRHEGYRRFPYKCSAGKLTIGIGRNIDDVGISKDEAIHLLENDIKQCKYDLHARYPVIKTLDETRQNVLVNMCFNLGIVRIAQFKKMWAALRVQDFPEASRQMLDSKWAKQVGKRADELAEIMKTGEQLC